MVLPVSSQLFSSLGGGAGGGQKIVESSVIKEMKAMMIWSLAMFPSMHQHE
jgi:hypothetical protein